MYLVCNRLELNKKEKVLIIEKSDVMGLLLDACPSYKDRWKEY